MFIVSEIFQSPPSSNLDTHQMKLTCHRATLASALQIVSGVIPSRTPKDILKNVKLEVEKNSATLIGTDTEIGIRYQIENVETDSTGELLLPIARVVSILRELTADSLVLEVNDDALWIRSGQSEFRLSLEDPSEYPSVEEFSGDDALAIPGKTLKELIKRTLFATDDESTRYALGGVQIELGELISFAATDSRRLAVATAPGGSASDDPAKPVIPKKAMSLIEKSLSEDEDVQLVVRGNDILVKTPQSTIYSRLVEGRFPNYRDVLPKESKATIDLVVGPFHSAVRQAQIVTNEESRGVDFQFSSGSLTLKSRAADVGESTIELPISYEGEEIKIMFDPRFVSDFLKVLEPEAQIQLKLISSDDPAVFHYLEDYTYVVMPLSRDED